MKTILGQLFFGLIIGLIMLLVSQRTAQGCLWIENLQPQNFGNITSILADTQNDCCQYCLYNFTDTFAAFFTDNECTCLNIDHKTINSTFNNSFYTYITRNPFKLNQSDYECGNYGTVSVLARYFVADVSDSFSVRTINMDLNMSLSTSILMMRYDTNLIRYKNTFVGFYYQARISNYFLNYTSYFKVGYVNATIQFAMAYTRNAYNPIRLIVYLKPFNVVANARNGDVNLESRINSNEQIQKNALISINTIRNDYFNSTADAENVTFVTYYNNKLMAFKEYSRSIGLMVADVAFKLSIQPNSIKFIIPILRTGASITFCLYFYSLSKDRQTVFHELSAMTFLNGSSVLQIKNKKLIYEDIETQKQARNHKVVGDIISLLQINDVILVCQWAIKRIKNYCGFLSLEGTPTFTRLPAVFFAPICFNNITQNIYFEDKFGNALLYNYLNKIPVRISQTKEMVIKLPSTNLPLTISKADKFFCCDTNTQIGSYNGLPYYISADAFIIRNSKILNWVQPDIYIPN